MSFYLPLGDDQFRPTRSTESPWDTEMQHGGPPAALLGRLLAVEGQRLARISVDFLGPIPRRDLRVEVSPLKPGRLTTLNEARMVIDGRVAVTARAWHLAPGPTPPVTTPADHADPLPEGENVFPGMAEWGYGLATEWRVSKGELGRADSETHVWTRVRMPLIDGHELDGQDRALIVADSANGLSAVLPMDKWLSIPPTMTTTLLRPAAGEWVHLACRTALSDDGLGLTSGELYDFDGAIGQVSQPLVVRAR
ncbi:thioesterase family protein [Paractinoplanes lichenicola]|uniref:Thioesterase family protein n=1 Tax=Paractinoplanes lichenicola TaxID=2802976 RepID=A0ABS1VN45_9ACTN|nr:thioesterase family protein [Actinoplanes lichenicola]MBL7256151.1 thioesterase family protein [Actinoplanes lichenicola]